MLSPALLAKYLGTTTNDPSETEPFSSVSINTATLKKGALFIALKGSKQHGIQFLEEAAHKGARMALIDQPVNNPPLPCLRVDNLERDLPKLAQTHRNAHQLNVIALTGSVGKTSTKNMLYQMLQSTHNTHATKGNQNNLLGVSLTLLGIGPKHESALIECGTNAPGEIAALTQYVNPTHSLILNSHPCHLQGLGSHQGVVEEKSGLISASGPNTEIVLPESDHGTAFWQNQAGKRHITTFGRHKKAHNHAQQIRCHDNMTRSFTYTHKNQAQQRIKLALPGVHQIDNALAALSITSLLGIPLEQAAQALNMLSPTPGRLRMLEGPQGAHLLDDCYNSSPQSFKVAIDLLSEQPTDKAVIVMGAMNELGDASATEHRNIGLYAKTQGIDCLLAVGDASQAACEAFGSDARWYASHDALMGALTPHLNAETTILIKGSRNQHMDHILNTLLESTLCSSG
jgi:UDP-N-acetylmuramoyl-tripeptide--D-alanyl-D-alanine ligase